MSDQDPDLIAIVVRSSALEDRDLDIHQVMLHTNALIARLRYNTTFAMLLFQAATAAVALSLGGSTEFTLVLVLTAGTGFLVGEGIDWMVRRKDFIS